MNVNIQYCILMTEHRFILRNMKIKILYLQMMFSYSYITFDETRND